MTTTSADVVIVGAGISGLLAAQHLQQKGYRVTVLEKSRGYGGRMAWRGKAGVCWDHGAQYLTAQHPELQALVSDWVSKEWIRVWFDQLPGHSNRRERYIGSQGMRTLPCALGEALDIRVQTRVTQLVRDGNQWTLHTDTQASFQANHVVLTPPVPQVRELLKVSEISLQDTNQAALQSVDYLPCLTLLLELASPSGLPLPGILVPNPPEPIAWIADNQLKGISKVPSLTVQSGPSFAATHLDAPLEAIEASMRELLREHLDVAVANAQVHRWRYALRTGDCGMPFVAEREMGLWVAGDGFVAPKIEGAVRSGLAVAQAIANG